MHELLKDMQFLQEENARLRKRVTELQAQLTAEQMAHGARQFQVTAERNSARYAARVLAHSYETGNRPPQRVVVEALSFAVDQRVDERPENDGTA